MLLSRFRLPKNKRRGGRAHLCGSAPTHSHDPSAIVVENRFGFLRQVAHYRALWIIPLPRAVSSIRSWFVCAPRPACSCYRHSRSAKPDKACRRRLRSLLAPVGAASAERLASCGSADSLLQIGLSSASASLPAHQLVVFSLGWRLPRYAVLAPDPRLRHH